jgi:4-hydroxy-tetrahydrodipicolinate reductase
VARLAVVLAGATGRTGSEVARALHAASDLDLVGAVARRNAGEDLGAVLGGDPWGVQVQPDLDATLARTRPDVLVDFTLADAGGRHALLALHRGVRPVVGTTGIPAGEIEEIERLAGDLALGAAIIPNFSFGVMLLQRFAVEALRFFPAVEVVEAHHDTKKDAPSGTAARLRDVLGARGARGPVPVHSLRLPGFVASHEVVFGGPGEHLSLRHDTTSRASFGPGVILACRRVMEIDRVVFDLAALLD